MSGFAWEILWSAGALALAIGMAWGAFAYLTRNRANDAITEEATREEYDDPNYREADASLKSRIR